MPQMAKATLQKIVFFLNGVLIFMYLFAFVFIYSCRFSLESDTGSQKKRQIRKGPAVWIWLWSIFLFFFFYEHFFSIQNVRWMVCKKAKRKEQFNAVLELWFFFFEEGHCKLCWGVFPQIWRHKWYKTSLMELPILSIDFCFVCVQKWS